MLPDPAAVQVAPAAPTQVHVAVSAAGNVSATVAPVALLGPALDAVIVYVTDPPGVAVVTPSVLVIPRSAVPDPAVTLVATDTLIPAISSSTIDVRQAPDVSDRPIVPPLACGGDLNGRRLCAGAHQRSEGSTPTDSHCAEARTLSISERPPAT